MYFNEKEAEIRKETSKFNDIQKKLVALKKDLSQASNEMKTLDKHLYNPTETVKAVTKANKLNYKAMINHFENRICELEQ